MLLLFSLHHPKTRIERFVLAAPNWTGDVKTFKNRAVQSGRRWWRDQCDVTYRSRSDGTGSSRANQEMERPNGALLRREFAVIGPLAEVPVAKQNDAGNLAKDSLAA